MEINGKVVESILIAECVLMRHTAFVFKLMTPHEPHRAELWFLLYPSFPCDTFPAVICPVPVLRIHSLSDLPLNPWFCQKYYPLFTRRNFNPTHSVSLWSYHSVTRMIFENSLLESLCFKMFAIAFWSYFINNTNLYSIHVLYNVCFKHHCR